MALDQVRVPRRVFAFEGLHRLRVEIVRSRQSIALRLLVHQGVGAAPFCQLDGRSRVPVGGGPGDRGDAGRPRLAQVVRGVRTAAVARAAL